MKFHLETGGGANVIRGYGPGHVKVNQQTYTATVVVLPDSILESWPPATYADLALDHFQRLVELGPEVVILGTGTRLRFPSPSLTRPLVEAQIGLEVMDTTAACRTYNILVSEGRRVAAALLMMEV
jgi:uncharacterized protein